MSTRRRSAPASALGAALALALLAACPPTPGDPPAPPAPDAWGPLLGPGGPRASFDAASLFQPCAYLDGGPEDDDHHNLVVMWDGHLLLPWAPEWSHGGISFFDVSDPCAPVEIGRGFDPGMRETHAVGIGLLGDRVYAAVNHHQGVADGELRGGVQFWDVTDPAAPSHASDLALPGYVYPDAYARVTLAVFWQGRYVYVTGADNGVWIVDAADPVAPSLAAQYVFDPPLRLGTFHVIGTVAMAGTAEGTRTVLMDLSDPLLPKPLPGGEFHVSDAAGEPRDYYFANIGGRYAFFARKESGGGFAAYDISDPRAPSFAGEFLTTDGNGGYVFRQNDAVFVGDSNFGGAYAIGADADPSDSAAATATLAAPVELGRATIPGDQDTFTPVGNVAVLSVDDDAIPGQASAVVPWRAEPDSTGPRVELAFPSDGSSSVPVSARIGLSFDEPVEGRSVFEGSFRVADADGWPVAGTYNSQENLVNFSPDDDLAPDTEYRVSVPAGGIIDWSGNPTEEDFELGFRTGPPAEGR